MGSERLSPGKRRKRLRRSIKTFRHWRSTTDFAQFSTEVLHQYNDEIDEINRDIIEFDKWVGGNTRFSHMKLGGSVSSWAIGVYLLDAAVTLGVIGILISTLGVGFVMTESKSKTIDARNFEQAAMRLGYYQDKINAELFRRASL